MQRSSLASRRIASPRSDLAPSLTISAVIERIGVFILCTYFFQSLFLCLSSVSHSLTPSLDRSLAPSSLGRSHSHSRHSHTHTPPSLSLCAFISLPIFVSLARSLSLPLPLSSFLSLSQTLALSLSLTLSLSVRSWQEANLQASARPCSSANDDSDGKPR